MPSDMDAIDEASSWSWWWVVVVVVVDGAAWEMRDEPADAEASHFSIDINSYLC
jgi:hypothetical protein